jgi:hypothetical protein
MATPSNTHTDGLPSTDAAQPLGLQRVEPRHGPVREGKVECNACPVLCHISEGRVGACDRYANHGGLLVRLDPVVFLSQQAQSAEPLALQARPDSETSPQTLAAIDSAERGVFVTGIGASTTYPDYKPAPFIVAAKSKGVDMVTVVTEGIFSYCSLKVKIDTDRYLGDERAAVLYQGEEVGHVTTAEYGSQMLSLGGVHHLTGGEKKQGRMALELMHVLGNQLAAEVQVENGAKVVLQAGRAPVVDGVTEQRMRVGCGSAAVGMFARQWLGLCDEVVVVDDHITGVLTEHQAGRCLNMKPSGINIKGRKSTPGRYFQVAAAGTGWGGTNISDPLSILDAWSPSEAWPGLRLLMTSTTGEHAAWFVLDEHLQPQPAPMPPEVQQVVERIGENCEPSLVSVLFLGGAGGSLRSGVTDNPIQLTRAVKKSLVNVTCGGAPAYVWPGGGITIMVDVLRMPANSFGTVPTPAIVAPIEFTMKLSDYQALGGHMGFVRTLDDSLLKGAWHNDGAPTQLKWETPPAGANPWPLDNPPMLG